MFSSIFMKTLRDGRRSNLLLGIGLALIGLYVSVLFPNVSDSFADLIGDLPDFLQSLVGDAAEFSTPEGYFSTQPFGVLGPVVMMVFAINRGISAVAGEEDGGTLDQLMANPVSRTSIVLHKSLALMISTLVLMVFLGASLVAGSQIMGFSFSIGGMLQMLLSLLLLSWALGFLALALGAATGSKSLAMAVSSAVAAVGYLIHLLAPLVDAVSFTRYVSVMYYYIGDRPFIHGLTYWHAGVLLSIAVISIAVALYSFNRRDLH